MNCNDPFTEVEFNTMNTFGPSAKIHNQENRPMGIICFTMDVKKQGPICMIWTEDYSNGGNIRGNLQGFK